MLKYLLRRIPSVVFVLLATSVIAFLLPRFAPGDPATAVAGPDATEAQLVAVRTQMGLDRPLNEQYFSWFFGIFRGDLGTSFVYDRPVADLVVARLGSTLELALFASIIMVCAGFGLGILGGSAIKRKTKIVVESINTLLMATPAFLLALLLIVLFGVTWRILPISGEVAFLEDPGIGIQYLILPALALGLAQAPGISRLLQTTMISTRSEDFVDLARSTGSSSRRVTLRHVARTSLGSAVVLVGLRVGDLFGGAVIIEAIFARNGLGQLALQATSLRDYELIQILILGTVLIAVISQLLTEVALAALDPRVSLEA